MARTDWLRRVDYLSTVSGGGYIGAFLGRYFDTFRDRPGEPEAVPGAVQARVAQGLTDPQSWPIEWLRRHSNYLAPGGVADLRVSLAGLLRNLLSIYLVLGSFFFALFGILNAFRYSHPAGPWPSLVTELIVGLSPFSAHLDGAWAGPWFSLAEASLWLSVVPLMIAYWLVSQDLPEAFVASVLTALVIVAAALLLISGSPLPLAIAAAAVIWAIGSWISVRRVDGPADPLSPFQLALTRERLTGWLATWLAVALGLAALGALDGAGRWLAQRMLEGGLTATNVARWVASVGSAVLTAVAFLRMAARFVAARSSGAAVVERAGQNYLWSILTLGLGVLPPLVALSLASHVSYEAGEAYARGLAVTLVATVVSLLFGTRECVTFVNRSGPLGIYSGRLARTFLGAVNPNRRLHPEGEDVARTVFGDDVPLANYRPDLAGGPLHLINCAVNQTVDVASYRSVRDRQAESLTVGPAGVSVSRAWHALWAGLADVPAGSLDSLEIDGPNPFLSRTRGPVASEPLTLREWVAISAAAIGPGMGPRTGLLRSALYTLANARLGYWWNSGLGASDRRDIPARFGLIRSLSRLSRRLFRAQWLFLSEFTGRFAGPWLLHWYLSDGGFFEVTGAYELIRRRVPFIILCDAGEDPLHQGTDLARLVQLVRIDLGAEITEVAAEPGLLAGLGVPAAVASRLGSLDDLLTPPGESSRKHAALLRVQYPPPAVPGSSDPWIARRLSWILYIKATVTGDEPADVRSYAASHPDFPNEPTLDQLFHETQWESYRELGEHIGRLLFAH